MPEESSHDPQDVVFLGRRRLRGHGFRAVLPPDRATGPGAARAALDLLRETESTDGSPRLLMGSIPFDPGTPAHLVVPAEVSAVLPSPRRPVPTAEPPAVPDDPAYRAAVVRALSAIGTGELRKVVLARSVDVRTEEDVDTRELLEAFVVRNPTAYGFHVPLADGSVLVGASPELVVDVDAGVVRSHPLAGTAARQQDAVADRRARDLLTASAKDRSEHAVLVQQMAADLAQLTEELRVPAVPSVLETARLWHLGTEVSGRLRPGTSALDVAYAVHPTAAVCGVPVTAAASFVADVERGDRGAFAGLVGWMDSAGNGEWALALRCTTVRGRTARVHAGAGIVAGSDAESEHAETAAKMRTALSALHDVRPDLRLLSPALVTT